MDTHFHPNPAVLGFDPFRFQRACDLLDLWCDVGGLPGAALCVGRKGGAVAPRFFGRLKPDALFMVASIAKPVVATGMMMLIERGLLTLDDRVARHLPEFAAEGKEEVRVRHLATHTSGLPDEMPGYFELRRMKQPVEAFVRAACQLPPVAPPGTRLAYQSMNTALLAEIVQRVTGRPLRDFLRTELFEPLGMTDTSLGWEAGKEGRIAEVQLPPEMAELDWNTPYWLGLGAPWAGLITGAADLARLCLMMLGGGMLGEARVLCEGSVRAMTSNQLEAMLLLPESDRRCRPWGLGWYLNGPGQPGGFSDLLGPRAYGHWGASGVGVWIDPDTESFCVLLTNRPKEDNERMLVRVSNAVAASLV